MEKGLLSGLKGSAQSRGSACSEAANYTKWNKTMFIGSKQQQN